MTRSDSAEDKNGALKTARPTNWDEYVIALLKDPVEAESFLKALIRDLSMGETDSHRALFIGLRDIVIAQGGLADLAWRTKMSRAHLYRILSCDGNPRLSTLSKILKGIRSQFAHTRRQLRKSR